eukprot:JP441472.1.p3 GENE.JP441472.1~~JP441472.1.p3  ORF type:complete len:62 (+),score=2.78 JP441472.1:85-270(+)
MVWLPSLVFFNFVIYYSHPKWAASWMGRRFGAFVCTPGQNTSAVAQRSACSFPFFVYMKLF